ncbi:S-layer homology domain-containing protein [Cohnella fermenti]|uniref:DNRLRE domain-containing protein n=1 Tax=Cohnella fermenti TaxID=2565925 RepID=A0A4S4BI25_9BACL|nr:S-layer homology domain-containing protein [Cohnella fermenti]THF73613.1 DNRLRE domain-containing protein [Cohnella fermenti]
MSKQRIHSGRSIRMNKPIKLILSFLCLALACMPFGPLVPGSVPAASAAGDTLSFPAAEDTFVSNFNNQGDSTGIALNSKKLIYGKLRHAYLKFDLSTIDTSRYAIDEMTMTLTFRKSHAPNELVFTESESTLSGSSDAWTEDNLTYNNRPNDIAGSPTATLNATSNGEESLSVDLSTIVRNALSNGRSIVSIHLTTAQVDDSTVAASELYSSRNTSSQPGPSLDVSLGAPIADDGVDRTTLTALIAAANSLTESVYTPETWSALAAALSAAIAVNSGASTQEEVDQAALLLQTAITALTEAEVPTKLAAPGMGDYFTDSKTAAMIFKLRNADGKYVKVDSDTEKLSLTADASEASPFALYVLDYFAHVNHSEPEVGATRTAYSLKSLVNGKFLTIQNDYTAEQFLSNTHRYYNIASGAESGTSTNRTFEVKASASVPGWNERFYIDHYASSGYYRIFSHLSTMRDDANFSLFNVRMTDDAMLSSGTSADNTEYRFIFEEVTGADLLEVSQVTAGSAAELIWRPVNGDAEPAHYRVTGSVASVVYDGALMRATLPELSAGVHTLAVDYEGSGYEAHADVKVRIFNHPGILLTTDDLDRMKQHVLAKEEPWYSDYQRLLDSVPYGVADSEYETTALSNVGRGGSPSDSGNIGYFEKGGNAAYFNALQWVITGDDAYAETAVDILNRWATTLQVIDGRDRILGAGINAYKFASAAEIVRYYDGGYAGYADSDFKALQEMMVNVVYPVIQDAAVPMIANGNWDLAAMVSMLAIGVLCDSTEMFDRAMNFYQDIHVNGSIFAYANDSGQTMETGRDQAHAMLALGYMAELAMIAYNQDEDLYSLYDNRLAKAFEYLAKYNLYSKELYGEDVPFVAMPNVFGDTSRGYYGAGFDRDSNGLNRGELRPVFEQGLALYTKVGGADMTWTKRAAEASRPQAMVHFDNLNFGTLTYYNGEPTNGSGPYFQLRTRWEPLYQRNWSTVDGELTAETLNSYYEIDESGELTTSVMKKDAPFFQLVSNNDGTYSIRSVLTRTYLSVKDETVGDANVIRADATSVGDNEKFLLRSSGVGPFFLASPKYDNRIVYQEAAGSGSGAVLTLRLGTKTLSQIADVADVTTSERLIFMYNTKEIALQGIAEPTGDAPVIAAAALAGGTVGAAYAAALTATGEGIRWTVSEGGLPAGLELSEAGVIGGTPTAPGTYAFTVKAENDYGSDVKPLSITISAAATPTSPSVSIPEQTGEETADPSPKSAALNGISGALTETADGGYRLSVSEQQAASALGDDNLLNITANDIEDLIVELPVRALESSSVTIETGSGTVSIPSAALLKMGAAEGDSLSLRIRPNGVRFELLKDGQPTAYDGTGAPLTVTLSVTKQDGHNSGRYVAVKRENGRNVVLPLAIEAGGKITFALASAGDYAVIDNGQDYTDVSAADWASGNIAFVTARGLFEGTGNGRFSPQTGMTRAMFAQTLANLEGIQADGQAPSTFVDVPGQAWYAAAAAWAAESGIVSGTGQDRFDPGQPVTREQMAVMLFNYAAYKGYKLPDGAAAPIADGDRVSPWAVEAVNALVAAGVFTGKPDGSFDPHAAASRAETATALARFVRALSASN